MSAAYAALAPELLMTLLSACPCRISLPDENRLLYAERPRVDRDTQYPPSAWEEALVREEVAQWVCGENDKVGREAGCVRLEVEHHGRRCADHTEEASQHDRPERQRR